MLTKNQARKLVKLFTTFNTHLSIFILVNAVLWGAWLFVLNRTFDFKSWPLYFSVGWLIILAVHLLVTYTEFRIKKNNP